MQIHIDSKVPEDIQKIGKQKLAELNLKARFVELIYHPGLKQFRVFDADTRKTVARFYARPSRTETPGETRGTGDNDGIGENSDPVVPQTERKARGKNKPAAT